MNKVMLMGRLVKDCEVRYGVGENDTAIGRYTLAVNRRGKKDEADFIQCVVFGRGATFAEHWLGKGRQVLIIGRLNVRSWEDKDGKRRWTTEVIVDEQHLTGTKPEGSGEKPKQETAPTQEGFYPIDDRIDEDDLPF